MFSDDALMTGLGDDITYIYQSGGSIQIKAVVDQLVQDVGLDGYTIEYRKEVEFLLKSITHYPVKGDRIMFNKQSFVVESVLFDDGHYVRVVVKS